MEMGFTDSRPLVPSDSSQGLRPFGWSELCARLVAAHDTRRELSSPLPGLGLQLDLRQSAGVSGPTAGQGCSFHDSAALLIRNFGVEPKVPVNPASSTNGNDAEGTEDPVPNAAPQRRPDEKCHD